MVQSGDDYRKKNRIRLQRFYEKQKKQGKKRVSALVSDEAYRLLTGEKEQTGESMSMLIDRAVTAAFGHPDIPNIDDPVFSEDFITNFEGPGQDGIPFEDIESDISLVDPEPETDDAAGADLVKPAAQGESESETAQADAGTQVVTVPAIDDTAIDAQDPDIIPDCTGKTITIEERDKILVQVAEAIPGRENSATRVDMLNEKAVPVSLNASKYGGQWDNKKFSDHLRFAKKRLGIK